MLVKTGMIYAIYVDEIFCFLHNIFPFLIYFKYRKNEILLKKVVEKYI